MIAFDNGPAHGDYVRYIDDLMKRGAIADATAVLPTESTGTLGLTRDRLTALAARGSTGQGDEWTRSDGRNTGFTTPTAPTASATAAAAIASALASGQMSGSALAMHTKLGIAAIVLGVLLIVIGIVAPLNVVMIAGGGVLIAWAVRMMRDANARGALRRT